MSEREPSAATDPAGLDRRGVLVGTGTPSRSENAGDGCNELRDAIRTAFPQIKRHAVERLIVLARDTNDRASA